MRFFWCWLAGVLQRRTEKRVALAERAADNLIVCADSDFARLLGIIPPLSIQVTHSHNLYAQMLGMGEAQIGKDHFAEMMRGQQQARGNALGTFGATLGMLGGPVGSAFGGMLGSAAGQLLGSKGKH